MSLTDRPKIISLFGSTGSIGQSTLDLIRHHPNSFKVKVLTAQKNFEQLAAQANEFNPEMICISDESFYTPLKALINNQSIKIVTGDAGLIECAEQACDLHIAAIMGFSGLTSMMAAMPYCRALGIANKEPLVAAGQFVLRAAQHHNVKIIPIDSEHNAIFQTFETHNQNAIERIYLTASGGAFRDFALEEIENKKPSDALKHPNWSMGAKITIDSATMMNKALELIEAHELFNLPEDKIEVLLHPESVIHGMVEYSDGSILSQMGAADMRTPIAHMLGFPARIKTSGATLSFAKPLNLNFSKLDETRFRAVALARQTVNSGLVARISFNAINEVLVTKFLAEEIAFGRIVPYIEEIMGVLDSPLINSLNDVIAYDTLCRTRTIEFLKKKVV